MKIRSSDAMATVSFTHLFLLIFHYFIYVVCDFLVCLHRLFHARSSVWFNIGWIHSHDSCSYFIDFIDYLHQFNLFCLCYSTDATIQLLSIPLTSISSLYIIIFSSFLFLVFHFSLLLITSNKRSKTMFV